MRIQQRQYKQLQKQMVATLPKERQREVVRQTKEEQMRKIAMLAMQYERTIADMAQQQTVSELAVNCSIHAFHALVTSSSVLGWCIRANVTVIIV